MILALLAIVVLLVVFVIGMYNGLVRLKVQCDNAWSDIDVQLKRRYDLIPNLVETVKGYAGHEKSTLEGVVAARNQAMNTQGPAAKAEAEGVLTTALRQVFALAEAYPQLKAVESFTQLQQTLSQIEDSVQNARRYYNAVVRDLNTKDRAVPFQHHRRNVQHHAAAIFRNQRARRARCAESQFRGHHLTARAAKCPAVAYISAAWLQSFCWRFSPRCRRLRAAWYSSTSTRRSRCIPTARLTSPK